MPRGFVREWRGTLGRLPLNFHRRKEWTSAAIGASLSAAKTALSRHFGLAVPLAVK